MIFIKMMRGRKESSVKKIFTVGILFIIGIIIFFVRYLSGMGIRYWGMATAFIIVFIIAMSVLIYVLKYRKHDFENHSLEVFDEAEVTGGIRGKEKQEDFGKTVLLQSGLKGKSYLLEVETGKKFFLEKENTIIGSQKESVDICLNVPTISRIHAKIICRNNQTFLIDLNSRNGTELDGEVLQPETEYLLKEENMIDFAEKDIYILTNLMLILEKCGKIGKVKKDR